MNEAKPATPDNRALLIFCAVPSATLEIDLPLVARQTTAGNSGKQD
jgi:hypothetical protein